MADYPWNESARIIAGAEIALPQEASDGALTLARAVRVVMENLPIEARTSARIEFSGGTLESSEIATIYKSPRFPLGGNPGRSVGGQAMPDGRRHQAA